MINYPIQRSVSMTGLPTLPNGKQYFIVGATNGNSSLQAIQNGAEPTPSNIIQVPKGSHINLPGMGMPVPTFNVSHTDLQVFYYTT